MEEIWILFRQMHSLLKKEMSGKEYQEFHILAKKLVSKVEYRHEEKQCEWKDSIDFFHNTDASDPFSFGQCGDHVYWKVVDRVLYIGGSGPMWNFDNMSVEFKNNDAYSPWQDVDYGTVMILNGVTTIGNDAFHGADISSIIIPESIKTIKSMAFFDAKIENLILPESIDTIEEGILNGFRRVVNSLTVSVNIANIQPFAFFNRDDIVANTIFLSGTLPDDITPIIESRLFDDVGRCKIFYPEKWDEADSFYERVSQKFSDQDDIFLQNLKRGLTPYKV